MRGRWLAAHTLWFWPRWEVQDRRAVARHSPGGERSGLHRNASACKRSVSYYKARPLSLRPFSCFSFLVIEFLFLHKEKSSRRGLKLLELFVVFVLFFSAIDSHSHSFFGKRKNAFHHTHYLPRSFEHRWSGSVRLGRRLLLRRLFLRPILVLGYR